MMLIRRKKKSEIFFAALKAFIYMFLIFWIFPLENVHFTCLASSTLGAFALPDIPTGKNSHLFFSYLIATAIGMLFSWIYDFSFVRQLPGHEYIFAGIITSFVLIALMAFHVEHPPAAGIGIGFILAPWTWQTPFALIFAIVGLILFRHLFSYRHKQHGLQK